ncbi:hypothetical protein OUZ56_024385 [Daphnia magna]|uniref:Uncharacterized protein n=1 Tax=Daphnia magna TaxID=35525 RepID=A0ABR0B0N7_9CRUS|nr:hypothetical protein OUZ56_024385 [Daphnia magna]
MGTMPLLTEGTVDDMVVAEEVFLAQYPQKVSERGPCFGLFYIGSYGGGYLARKFRLKYVSKAIKFYSFADKITNYRDLLTSMLVNK